MTFFDPQNPGIGGLDELTDAEALTIQNISGLGDPNADRLLFWDDSAGAFAYLTLGTNLSITGTTLNASGGGSGVNVETPTGTVDGLTFVYTATNVPKFVVVDNSVYFSGLGYTLTGAGPYTITMDDTVAPTQFIRSIY